MTDEQLEKRISEEFEKSDRELADSFTEKIIFSRGFKAAALPLMKMIEEIRKQIRNAAEINKLIAEENESLKKELHQQKFNNEHNLSIDQKVSDE
jgi:hypothetical protein